MGSGDGGAVAYRLGGVLVGGAGVGAVVGAVDLFHGGVLVSLISSQVVLLVTPCSGLAGRGVAEEREENKRRWERRRKEGQEGVAGETR